MRWIIHKIGEQALCSWILLLVALCSVALGLGSIIRGLDGGLVLTVIALAIAVGWIVAQPRLPGWAAGLIAVGLGVGFALVRVGQLGNELALLLRAWVGLLWQVVTWQTFQPRPDAQPALLVLSHFANALATLVARLRDWLLTLAAGAPTFDPVAVALMWSLVLWFVAAWAAWAVRRRERPFEALLPGIALLAATLGYVDGSPTYLIPALGAWLLLMILSSAGARERQWNLKGIDFAEDIRFDVAMSSVPLAVLLLSLAAIVPSVSVAQVARYVQRSLASPLGKSNPFSDSLGLIQQPKPESIFDEVRMPGLPRQHLLGSGPELSKRLVMTVRIDDPLPKSPSPNYWRSVTYDRYTGRGWMTNATEEVTYGAGERTIDRASAAQRLVQQDVQVLGDTGGLILAAGTLVTADRDFRVAWRSQPDGDIFGANIGVSNYHVESLVPVAGEAELRSAGSIYPGWIGARYLDLPDDLPERVRVLARDLTAVAPTPYDRARAIEAYLRQFPYTLDVTAPPATRDVVDYFLFDLRRGYCDYYASAMVVLARAAGLPTRLVVGYAMGTFDESQARYIVSEADAHSWVEVYFPSYGWIEFEPTAGRAPIERSAQAPLPQKHETNIDRGETRGISIAPDARWWLALPAAFTFLALVVFLGLRIDGWRLRRLAPETALDRIYSRLSHHSRRLGVPARPSDTPDEIADLWKKKLAGIAEQKGASAPFQQAQEEIGWLTDVYVKRRYSPRGPDIEIQRQAVRTWDGLRLRLWYAWVWQLRHTLFKRRRVRKVIFF